MISDFLNKPYPHTLNKWKIVLFVSGFIFLFLLIFQPFGINQIHNERKIFILLGYGLVTGIALIFCQFFLPLVFKNWFKDENWTVKSHLSFMAIIILSIGTGNFIYSIAILHFSFSLQAFLIFQVITLCIGIIPVGAISILKFNRLLKQNLKIALDVNNNLQTKNNKSSKKTAIELLGDNNKDKVILNPDDLLFIQSEGNYIQIVYKKEQKVIKSVLRCSLKNIEAQLKSINDIYRCHRAFIVNLSQIESLIGNAQGLKIRINNYNETLIPISRSLSSDIKNRLNNIH